MSASPAQPPSGPNSVTPTTGGSAPLVRKKPPVNIFNTNKKKPLKKNPPPAQRPAAPQKAPNSLPQVAAAPQAHHAPAADPSQYEEYPIVISRRQADTGQRYHAMRLQTRPNNNGQPTLVDPYKTQDFTRPLRLHRRYARDKMEAAELSDAASGDDDKERELMNARRLERQAEREENQKLIAPTGGESAKPNKKKPQKRVEEGRDDTNPVRQKRQQLRYEEARPWHLEDFEGKNVWVGSYEDALSERSIMFELQEGHFRMIPIEKWYKFIQTNKVNAMSAEEVEKHLQKKVTLGRWAMGTQKANDEARLEEVKRQRAARRAAREDDDDERQLFTESGDFQADKDMLDMEFNDEFQDDDEGMLYQGEEGEDGKEIEQRLWLEMRDAGLSGTGVKDENIDPEEEERKRQVAEEEQKKKEKKLKKQLMRRENKGEYLSDDDSNPYEDSSEEDDDSETERAKDEEQKQEEAKKQLNGDKSGASSRGTNTPSGRPEKRSNPDMSDLSGNESSRKKVKGLNGVAIPATGGGRSLSPDAAKARPKIPRSTGGSGSGSDTDTSRAGRPKLKVKHSPPGSPSSVTPTGSRAASPSATGSRAQSPKPNGANGKLFPTLEEVRAAIPATGIEIKALVALFKAQVGTRGAEFIPLVKKAGVQDKATGKIMPKS